MLVRLSTMGRPAAYARIPERRMFLAMQERTGHVDVADVRRRAYHRVHQA